jgi:putative ABC transport system substrate-binding protein
VGAQSGSGIATIGVLNLAPEVSPAWWMDALRKGLLEHDWVEGRTFRLVSRSAEGKTERLPLVAADLVALKVDVIVTAGTTSIRAARDATRTIPIVMAAGADPVTMGFAASLARPGGKVTGLSILGGVKRMELLKEAVPRATRVGVLLHRANPGNAAFLTAIREAAPKLKVSVSPSRSANRASSRTRSRR